MLGTAAPLAADFLALESNQPKKLELALGDEVAEEAPGADDDDDDDDEAVGTVAGAFV